MSMHNLIDFYPITFSLMKESPRWLLTQKRYDRAYKIVFKQPSHYEIKKPAIDSTILSDKKIVRFLIMWLNYF